MVRENRRVFFTEEDRLNLKVHKYSADEMKQNLMDYRNKNNKRRGLCIALFLILLIPAIFVNRVGLSYAADIGLFAVFVAFTLSEILYRLNMGNARLQYYIEIEVMDKLKVETVYENDVTTGAEVFSFYPVRGKDTASGYVCICYVDKEQYKNTAYGEKIRISVKEKNAFRN